MKQYQGAGAKGYDAARCKQAKWQWEDHIVRDVLARFGGEIASVIDAPVGTGRFLSLYRVPTVGYDVSADMLNVARELHPDARLERLDLLREAIPERADLVVCVRFLNLVDTPAATLALGKLLDAANKYALFTVRIGKPQRIGKVYVHSLDAVATVLERHGFEVAEDNVFPDNVSGDYNLLLCKRGAA